MTKKIEFYFDFGSSTAFLAYKELQKLARAYYAEIEFKPMLLGAVFKATNNIAPGTVQAKGMYMLRHDIPRFVKRYNVEFKMNPHFPVNTLMIMRGCFAAKQMGCFDEYVDCIFDGMWVKGADLSKEEVFKDTLSSTGIDAHKLLDLIGSEAIKEELKTHTEAAIKKGCFGAPTMFIGDEMFFGQDRLDFIEEELSSVK